MAEQYKSYRIRTKVGQDAPNVINVQLDQTYDTFQILSLTIDQENVYKLYQSDKGIVVGRVLANGGVGVSNAKVSIFVPTDDTMGLDKHIIYPYSSVNDINDDRVRYNLLPDYVDEACHQNVGTFPNKRYVLDNDDVIEIFDRFWKYTTVTNSAGDYMLYGIPCGSQTLHMDVDLSDIGLLSQKPRDLAFKGFNMNLFESPTKFREDTNLNSLAQIKTQDIGVYVYPFWGDSSGEGESIAVTRCDIQVDYKFEPTCVFMGCIITDTGSNAIGKNCAGTDSVGKMSDLVAGEGSIEMIRKTIDNKVEEFQVKGNRLIDGDGVWCYQIPMNLDYVMTDEFGNLVPTDNPDKGIPTRARVRFRISLDEAPSDNEARKRCKYLVPNNPRLDADRFPVFTADKSHEPDYEFGTNTREESYCDLFWNKVYTVKNYIPRFQKNTKITNRNHTGIKLINHYGDNNPMPYNNLGIKLTFTYRFICVLTKIFIMLVGFINNLLSIIGAIPCEIAKFFRKLAGIFKWPVKFLGAPFRAAAKVFDKLTPSCIAISSEFCTGDVTHAYTFYPGCGQNGIARVIGSMADCVWEKTQDLHYDEMKNVRKEDRTEPINKDAELYNCVESQLAEDNDATSFNFHNDWINGTLYSPLWYRKITPKRRFFFGLFSRSAKDEWCSADHAYNGLIRIFQPCAVKRDGTTNYTNHDGKTQVTGKFMSVKPGCGTDCHETTTIVGLNTGVIRTKQTMLGQTVYYYKPVEFEAMSDAESAESSDIWDFLTRGNAKLNKDDGFNGTLKLLFATDIVLLGSLNDCDLNGVPQFFKSLESSTYKLPPNMLFTDNNMVQQFNEDGTISTRYDQVSTTEMTGNDWGNNNDDMCGEPDGGLFYDIGCSSIEMIPKSCINLSRICEFGVSLDEAKQVPNTIERIKDDGDNAFITLVPDGFISKDELYNDNERSMFATMNGNELRTKLNTENGLKEYDFRHLYVDNFDNSLRGEMTMRQRKCTDITYKANYNLEEFSPGYYDFRMGKSPFYYDGDNSFPRYENSFYFYFGLKVGKTAIDKFNSQFFAECHNPEDAVSPIGLELQGNTWCSEADNENDGFVKIDLSNVALPCDILIKDRNSDFEFLKTDIEEDKVIIAINSVAEQFKKDYKQICCDDVCALDNGEYRMTVTDADGEITVTDFTLSAPYLKYNVVNTNFKRPENVLLSTHDNKRKEIAKDDDKVNIGDFKYTREIGGTIAILNVIDGMDDEKLKDFNIEIVSVNVIEDWPETDDNEKFGPMTIAIRNGSVRHDEPVEPSDYRDYFLKETEPFIIGVPKGDERYRVTVIEYCGDKETNNRYTQTVYIGDMTPYKLYIDDIIDYDVISHWGTGYELKNLSGNPNVDSVSLNGSSPTYFDKTKFSENWLHISDFDGKPNGTWRYYWDRLVSYQKCLKKINKALKNARSIILEGDESPIGDDEFPKSRDDNSNFKFSGIYNNDEINHYINDYEGFISRNEGNSDDIRVHELISYAQSIIDEFNNILEIKSEFIRRMKTAFWMTCPEESKTITFRATTDDMPVAFYIAYRSERTSDDGNYNILEYDEENNLYYSFNEERRIDDIMIPSLTIRSSEKYGIDVISMSDADRNKYLVNSDVSLALDNRSNYSLRNRQKYAFFVGVINSLEQVTDETNDEIIPNGDTIPDGIKGRNYYSPNTSKLFGFHILDKILDIKHIAWAYMNGIPYFMPQDEKKNGYAVLANGLFAGKIKNGVVNKVNEDNSTLFETQKVGKFKMEIVTPSTDGNNEDSMPTKRYISGSTNSQRSYFNWRNYMVDAEFENTASAGGKTAQYVPLLPATTEMELEDASNCSISEEIYGGMRITLLGDSVVNCKDKTQNILHVKASNGPDDGTVAYFVYELKKGEEYTYPLNAFNLAAETDDYSVIPDRWFNTMEKSIGYSQTDDLFVNGDENKSYKLFSILCDKETLIAQAANYGYSPIFGSELLNEDGENVTVCEYFNIETDDNSKRNTYNAKTISSTGLFKNGDIRVIIGPFVVTIDSTFDGKVYVVARTENECRAISPVYSFEDIFASVVHGIVHTKVVKSTSGGGDTPEGGGDEGGSGGDSGGEGGEGGEGGGSQTETIETKAIGFYVTNAAPNWRTNENHEEEMCIDCLDEDDKRDGVYYLNYFDYELHAICELDPLHVVEDTALIPAANNTCDIDPLFVNVDDDTYEIVESYISNDRCTGDDDESQDLRNALAAVTDIEITDVTGLRHISCINAKSPYMYKDDWNAVTYRPNGGYWYNKANHNDTSDTSFKTKFISTNHKQEYDICEFFGVPQPSPQMKEEGAIFAGWYEIDDEETLYDYVENEDGTYICNGGLKLANDGPKIFVAQWNSPSRITITWVANDGDRGYFNNSDESTKCTMKITKNEEDGVVTYDPAGPYECPCGTPFNTSPLFVFKEWTCDDDTVTITPDGKIETDHSCTITAAWKEREEEQPRIILSAGLGCYDRDSHKTEEVILLTPEDIGQPKLYVVVDRLKYWDIFVEEDGQPPQWRNFLRWEHVSGDCTIDNTNNTITVNTFETCSVRAVYENCEDRLGVTWLTNGGHFTDGSTSYYQPVADPNWPKIIECRKGDPVREDGLVFKRWQPQDDVYWYSYNYITHVVTIDVSGEPITDGNVGTIIAEWGVPEKVKVTFVVSDPGGKWYNDGTDNYVMRAEINTYLYCDRVAQHQDPLRYGFIGWRLGEAHVAYRVEVWDDDRTVNAVFREKNDCIIITDYSSGDNIAINVDMSMSYRTTGFSYDNVSIESYSSFNSDNKGEIMLFGVTNQSVLKIGLQDEIFVILNGDSEDAKIYSNGAWHINDINKKLQLYNIKYTKPELTLNYMRTVGTPVKYDFGGEYKALYEDYVDLMPSWVYNSQQYAKPGCIIIDTLENTHYSGWMYMLWPCVVTAATEGNPLEFFFHFNQSGTFSNLSDIEIIIGDFRFRYEDNMDYEVRNGVAGQITTPSGMTLDIHVRVTRVPDGPVP